MQPRWAMTSLIPELCFPTAAPTLFCSQDRDTHGTCLVFGCRSTKEAEGCSQPARCVGLWMDPEPLQCQKWEQGLLEPAAPGLLRWQTRSEHCRAGQHSPGTSTGAGPGPCPCQLLHSFQRQASTSPWSTGDAFHCTKISA